MTFIDIAVVVCLAIFTALVSYAYIYDAHMTRVEKKQQSFNKHVNQAIRLNK